MFTQVFTSQTANGDSTKQPHTGGEVEIVVKGTFDGATVTAYADFVNGPTACPLDGGSFTAANTKVLKTVRPCSIYFTVTNAGASTSINAWV